MFQDFSQTSSTGFAPIAATDGYILGPNTPVSITVPLKEIVNLRNREQQLYILEAAAASLNVPVAAILNISYQDQHIRKRSRPNPELSSPMRLPYMDNTSARNVQEKTPLGVPLGRLGASKPFAAISGAFQAGWSGSRIGDCLPSLGLCPPCSPFDAEPGKAPTSSPGPFEVCR